MTAGMSLCFARRRRPTRRAMPPVMKNDRRHESLFCAPPPANPARHAAGHEK